jgi:hypothetical protein
MLPASAAQPSHDLTVLFRVHTLLQVLRDAIRCTGHQSSWEAECHTLEQAQLRCRQCCMFGGGRCSAVLWCV